MQISLSNTSLFVVLPKGNTVAEFLFFGFPGLCLWDHILKNSSKTHTHKYTFDAQHFLSLWTHQVKELVHTSSPSVVWNKAYPRIRRYTWHKTHYHESVPKVPSISINFCGRWGWRICLFKQLTGMATNSQNRSKALSRLITFTLKSSIFPTRIISEKHFTTS